MKENKVIVVGGVNMDIGGTAYAPLVKHDSNPGRVRLSPGGVGRNIAHNMRLLGLDVSMLTVLGDDIYAGEISASCARLGIDLSLSLHAEHAHTSTYLFVAGVDGEMEYGLADMDIYDLLTPEYLASKKDALDEAALIVADTNIPAAALEWLADNCRAPLFVDPVSTAKAAKAAPVLGKIHTLKPNRIEAEMLSGVEASDDEGLRRCAEKLLSTGLKRVFISLGADGVYAAEAVADESGTSDVGSGASARVSDTTQILSCRLPCFESQSVGTTGCGDAFMAALAWSFLKHRTLEDSAKAGLAASAVAMECTGAINPELCEMSMLSRAGLDGVLLP